jgi:hypothetical protein
MREERIELLCQIVLSTLPMVEESLTARVVGCHISSVAVINRQLGAMAAGSLPERAMVLCVSRVIASIAGAKQ